MAYEILTPTEMNEADRLTIAAGPENGYALMLNAGEGIVRYLLAEHGEVPEFHILCGPGNNGGDGYVIARTLAENGVIVQVWSSGAPKAGSDAAQALDNCPVSPMPIESFDPRPGSLVVDALFGAGLDRPVAGKTAAALERANAASVRRVAVDVPSGLDGATGQPLGAAFKADSTITFFRKKPGHLLYPGRTLCGDLFVIDIGIKDEVLTTIEPHCFENAPALWRANLPSPGVDTHKYRRGHVAVFSGGATSTGAARLSALAAARSGAGAVTILSPGDALAVNAAHVTSIMLSRCDHEQDLSEFIAARAPSAFVIGPGFGIGERTRTLALQLLQQTSGRFVFDADAITSFKDRPEALFAAAQRLPEPQIVLTPHEGEFKRLFPDLDSQTMPSKLERARTAAARSNGVIVYKGPDTVIAAPDGRAAINTNGTPNLATAGSGDVLSGLVAGLMAQGMAPFDAACAAVHVHAAAGRDCGFGLIAEDLPAAAAKALAALCEPD